MIGKNIRRLRRERHMTLAQLGAACSVSKQTVQRYESGVIENIPPENISLMAQALGVSPSLLMGWEEDAPAAGRLPLLGGVSCGKPIYIAEGEREYVSVDDPDADFCLVARGDSMIGAGIYDGDIVFIRAQDTVENGEVAVVVIDDEATLKTVFFDRERERLVLSAENPCYAPLVYSGAELQSVHIIGRAVGYRTRSIRKTADHVAK